MRTIRAGVGAGVEGTAIGGTTIAGGITAGARGCPGKLENSCEKGVGEATGLGSGVVAGS